jgi:ABC-type uncharacterized transport system substrate-binding protein
VSVFYGVLGPKRLELLQELVPKVALTAMLVNPASPYAEQETNEVLAAGRTLGLQIHIVTARTAGEIDAAFGTFVERWSCSRQSSSWSSTSRPPRRLV